jgi:phage gpG-like protein
MIAGKVGLVGSDKIDRKLEQVAAAADDLGDMWPEVGEVFAERQRAIFTKGGRPRWKPLDPDYILQRRRDGLGGRTLIRTGLLRDAVTQAKPAKTGPKFAVFGPAGRTAPHWVLHKHGTKRMPKRDPLPKFSKAERKRVRDLIAEHVVKPWGGA